MRVTFLGTGTSRGVPVVGCRCAVCMSEDPRNKRLRSSILVQGEGSSVVIDASTDFRQQMLREWVETLDAVVLTHHHADHILGLDDVFPYYVRAGRNLPLYGSAATLQEVSTTFRHLFGSSRYPLLAQLEPREISGPFRINDLELEPVDLLHGNLPILGFRISSFAYLTDVSHIPEPSWSRLEGLDCVVIDALRYRKHPTHFTIAEAVQAAQRIGARQTYLIHMCHDVDHQTLSAELPAGVEPAFDGLVLEL
jgi:phosphoribosyl 1,2-cyclic phosphate phosphodiesterase